MIWLISNIVSVRNAKHYDGSHQALTKVHDQIPAEVIAHVTPPGRGAVRTRRRRHSSTAAVIGSRPA